MKVIPYKDKNCPKCNGDNLDGLVCENFLDGKEWFEYTCKDCHHTWQESESDEQ